MARDCPQRKGAAVAGATQQAPAQQSAGSKPPEAQGSTVGAVTQQEDWALGVWRSVAPALQRDDKTHAMADSGASASACGRQRFRSADIDAAAPSKDLMDVQGERLAHYGMKVPWVSTA
eukprot:8805032-Alexandrium_andersonii.AAC.1